MNAREILKYGHQTVLRAVDGMRFRTVQTLEAHLGLTLAGYAVIEVERSRLKQSFYKVRRGLVSGRVPVPSIVLDEVVLTA